MVLAALEAQSVRAAAVTLARPSLDDVYLRHAGRAFNRRGDGGMTPLRQTWQITLRYLRVIARQPAFLFIALVQPIIWLLLFGALFKAVTEIPGFGGGSYIDFLTPGVVVMLAVSSAGWTGMGFIEDIDSGVMDRMLASPVWRGALNLGSVLQAVIQILIQTLLIVLLALALGAHYENGVGGVLVLMLVASLLGAAFASLSNGLAVVTRQRESLIGAVTMVLLPLTFLSSALMQQSLAPDWIGTVARFNPVNWAVEAGRSAAFEPIDWGLVAGRVALLGALVVVAGSLATRAFRGLSAVALRVQDLAEPLGFFGFVVLEAVVGDPDGWEPRFEEVGGLSSGSGRLWRLRKRTERVFEGERVAPRSGVRRAVRRPGYRVRRVVSSLAVW